MTYLYLYLTAALVSPDIKIIEKSANAITMDVSFIANETEPVNIGFIASSDVPVFNYKLISCDTTIEGVSPNGNPIGNR